MKKTLLIFGRLAFAMSAIAVLTHVSACKKNGLEGPNDLNGETDIPLTQIGNESSIYLKSGNSNEVSGTVTVIGNNNGVVTYRVIVDFTGHPDSAFYASVIPADKKDAQGRVNTTFKCKITSEGIQDYSGSGSGDRPWTIIKYADGVGTEYPFATDITYGNGSLKRTITEKTGLDEWPLGFYNIKTTKIEQPYPADDDYVKKLNFRANHKFGIVYIEAELKTGVNVSLSIYPWFLL
jgi:hypothetical protein